MHMYNTGLNISYNEKKYIKLGKLLNGGQRLLEKQKISEKLSKPIDPGHPDVEISGHLGALK